MQKREAAPDLGRRPTGHRRPNPSKKKIKSNNNN